MALAITMMKKSVMGSMKRMLFWHFWCERATRMEASHGGGILYDHHLTNARRVVLAAHKNLKTLSTATDRIQSHPLLNINARSPFRAYVKNRGATVEISCDEPIPTLSDLILWNKRSFHVFRSYGGVIQ